MKLSPAAAFLLLAAASGAWADTVHLRNGSSLQGRVIRKGDQVLVEMDFGTVAVAASEVLRIDSDLSPIQEFEERRREISPNDPDALVALALWARERELDSRARELLEKALALAPDHEGARRALGFRLHEGRWLSDEQYFAETGRVKFRGAWIPREEAEKIEREEAEQRDAAAARRMLAEAERSRAEAEARLIDAQAELERARADAERERARRESWARVYVVGVIHHHVRNGRRFPCAARACAPEPCPPTK